MEGPSAAPLATVASAARADANAFSASTRTYAFIAGSVSSILCSNASVSSSELRRRSAIAATTSQSELETGSFTTARAPNAMR